MMVGRRTAQIRYALVTLLKPDTLRYTINHD